MHHYQIPSSSNDSRGKSKKRLGLALTMNPISTTNFKHAIGNLPIKASRDDDMLFSFRNQAMSNRSIKESDTEQLPESINSKHGKITYLMANLEENIGQFFQDFKLNMGELDEMDDIMGSSSQGSSTESYIKDECSEGDYYLDDTDENSLVTLLDLNEKDELMEDNRNKRKRRFTAEKIDLKLPERVSEPTLNITTIDPLKISKSSTTPKSRSKRIKPQIVSCKSAKSTNSKKSSKCRHHQISKTADMKIKKMLSGDKDSKSKRIGEIPTKKSISSKQL